MIKEERIIKQILPHELFALALLQPQMGRYQWNQRCLFLEL